MTLEFNLQGTNHAQKIYRDVVKSDAMSIAMKRSGYKLLQKRVSWPRVKGPAGVRVDVSTGAAVAFVR
jgi:hypothetical protein